MAAPAGPDLAAGARSGADSAAAEPGILHPSDAAARFDYRRHTPDERLSPFVTNFWTIVWDLRGQSAFTAQVLPYPSVNLSVTNTEADVTGLTRRRYERHLTGRGYAVGVRFRPACFRPLIDGPVARLTDRHRPISEVLGRDTGELRQQVHDRSDPAERVHDLAAFLTEDWPEPDDTALHLAEVVETVSGDRLITRVGQLAELAQLSVRSLQRTFAEYVGAGPKWVIQRCRLHDVARRVAADEAIDWADLAIELGFADQAHLIRAFTATVGTPPATYAREVHREDPGSSRR